MKQFTLSTLLVFSFLLGSKVYAFSEISERIYQAYMASPLNLLSAPAASDQPTRINLLKWNENPQDPPPPPERYVRELHFSDWLVLNADKKECLDVRNQVLLRDSKSPVKMREGNPCKIDTGSWYDPYTDKTYHRHTDVQIDHFVPLKDAYVNGAWKWNYQTRCVYSNYMGYADHLKPVNADENQFKSDHSPDQYMPPNSSYKCAYLKTWLSIKLIWKLGMQRAEAQGIKDLIAQEKCDGRQFTFSEAELKKQRQIIQSALPFCPQVPQNK